MTDQPSTPDTPPTTSGKGRHRLLLISLLGLLLVRTFLIQQFYISGPSMQQTLHQDDRVVVEKITGRLRHVARGDVIVFHHQTDEGRRELIKRVVGLPGEIVEVRACQVYVNGDPLSEPYLDLPALDCGGDTAGPVTVGTGEVFVLGDNRPQSADSRTFGPVLLASVVGRAVAVVWPPSAWRQL